MVYFLQSPEGGPVKIGHSANVEARRVQLESRYRQSLDLIATMEGGPAEERAIHERFSHLRIGRTEQFRPGPDLMSFIGRPSLVGANPGAIDVEAMRGSAKFAAKATPEYRDWMSAFAEKVGGTEADVFREAMRRYAVAEGFRLPPLR